jgi:hypothetical protein
MADSSYDGKLMLLQNLLEIKAAEFDLLARQLRGLLLQNQVSPMLEDDFRGAVSEIMHKIGMVEQEPACLIWKQYCGNASLILHFETARTFQNPFTEH